MAGKRKRPNGWEYVFKRAGVLEKPLSLTFTDEAEGDAAFARRLDTMLAAGIVPTEFVQAKRVLTIADLVRQYQRDAHPSEKDVAALSTIVKTKGATPLTSIAAAWVPA